MCPFVALVVAKINPEISIKREMGTSRVKKTLSDEIR